MTSSLSWVDHSEAERRRALEVVDLFRDRGTVDELGIGVIRDTFADTLFPGTSTIQTRAKYFLFVPWIYRIVERQRSSGSAAARARSLELRLIKPLAQAEDHEGVIGAVAGRGLKRLPSNAYWRGLLSWGIRVFPGTQPQFHRLLDSPSREGAGMTRDDDGNPLHPAASAYWHARLPPHPVGFPDSATLALSRAEAGYLRDRILASNRRSMLAEIIDRGVLTTVNLPWEHPLAGEMPTLIAELIDHARAFSECMHGAQLLYNLLVAERAGNEEWETTYAAALEKWKSLIEDRSTHLEAWDRTRFWDLVVRLGGRPSFPTRIFSDTWLQAVLGPQGPGTVERDPRLRTLISERERTLKGSRARLHNDRALALWGGDSGSRQLDYRWRVSQQIVNDILVGLDGDA